MEGRDRFFVWEDYSLNILALQAGDTGTYRCTATNAVGTTALDYRITVQCKFRSSFGCRYCVVVYLVDDCAVSPRIVTEPRSQTVTPGARVMFSCHVIAQPPASITWRKAGSRLLPSFGLTSYPNGTLVIHSVTETNAGYYQCSADNILGQATSQAAFLNVRCE